MCSYIVAVASIDTKDMECKVLPGTAEAEFTLTYKALVMKPFKNEVVDAVVDKVGKVRHGDTTAGAMTDAVMLQLGFFAYLGPMQIFISSFVSLWSFSSLSSRLVWTRPPLPSSSFQ